MYLMSSNLAEITAVAFSFMLKLTSPLLPLQILFLNLVTDVFPALALGVGKSEKNIMNMPPRRSDEPIMTKMHWKLTASMGLIMSLSVVSVCYFAERTLEMPPDQVNNLGFYTLVFVHMVNVFNLPLNNRSFFNNRVLSNPWIWGALLLCTLIMIGAYTIPIMSSVLSLVPISWDEFKWVLLFGMLSMILTQIIKRLFFGKMLFQDEKPHS